MELTPNQVFLVGLAATALAFIIRLIVAKTGKEISKTWMTVIVSVVSVILAVLFKLPDLPVYEDPLQFLGELSTLLSAYVGFATLVYNLLMSYLIDKLNLNTEQIAARNAK